jgi:hypothetical protein
MELAEATVDMSMTPADFHALRDDYTQRIRAIPMVMLDTPQTRHFAAMLGRLDLKCSR